ncbi:VapC toxin family PIN domain ribonuclease, partial [Salmonella enterica subsp. enterica serovar Uganda]|nr:VapC toxin family PIN domain ribonuclease [Salmonella enterica subsp. enterica serovar Uganda]
MYVIDTNVVSELRRASVANANVVAWIDSVDRQTLFASAIMLHELEVGI